MGLFSGIKNTYQKSIAAVVVQNLLEHQAKAGIFDGDPASVANKLVAEVWDHKPDIFNGTRRGDPAHPGSGRTLADRG